MAKHLINNSQMPTRGIVPISMYLIDCVRWNLGETIFSPSRFVLQTGLRFLRQVALSFDPGFSFECGTRSHGYEYILSVRTIEKHAHRVAVRSDTLRALLLNRAV